MAENLLNPILLSFDYWKNHMSMFLKESYGELEKAEYIYFNLLTAINNSGSKFLEIINKFMLEYSFDKLSIIEEFKDVYNAVENPVKNELYHYFEKINEKYVLTEDTDIDPTKTYYTRSNFFVDMLSSLAGVNRETMIIYKDENDEPVKKIICLNSLEMIILSRLQFYVLGFDGSFKNLTEKYAKAIDKLKIYYITTDVLTVSIVIVTKELDKSLVPNLLYVLENGDYLIKSLGITYSAYSVERGLEKTFTFRALIDENYDIVSNPVESELLYYYEKVNNEYIPAKEPYDSSKTYYLPKTFKQVNNPSQEDFDAGKYYELIDGEYVPAEEPFDDTKTYYTRFHDFFNDDESRLL